MPGTNSVTAARGSLSRRAGALSLRKAAAASPGAGIAGLVTSPRGRCVELRALGAKLVLL